METVGREEQKTVGKGGRTEGGARFLRGEKETKEQFLLKTDRAEGSSTELGALIYARCTKFSNSNFMGVNMQLHGGTG